MYVCVYIYYVIEGRSGEGGRSMDVLSGLRRAKGERAGHQLIDCRDSAECISEETALSARKFFVFFSLFLRFFALFCTFLHFSRNLGISNFSLWSRWASRRRVGASPCAGDVLNRRLETGDRRTIQRPSTTDTDTSTGNNKHIQEIKEIKEIPIPPHHV